MATNRHPALVYCLCMISGQTLRVCPEGKPVSIFPNHALLIEPWPLGGAVMRDGAARRLADQSGVFGQRASPMPRRSRFPCLSPLREFGVIDQHIHAARAGIDTDAIALAHQRQRTADE